MRLCGPGSGRSGGADAGEHIDIHSRTSGIIYGLVPYHCSKFLETVYNMYRLSKCFASISKNYIEDHLARTVVEIIIPLNSRIKLTWVPSHQSITGNENADELAKSATLLDNITGMPYSAADILAEMKVNIQARWQQE